MMDFYHRLKRVGYCVFMFLLMTMVAQAQNTFKDPLARLKIINQQSTNSNYQGESAVRVAHRWGYTNSNTAIHYAYGLVDGLQVSVGGELLRATYSGSVKMELFHSTESIPVDISAYTSIHVNTALKKSVFPRMRSFDRLSYGTQLIAATEPFRGFHVQVAPTFIRQNLVWNPSQLHNQWALGLAAYYDLTKSWSLAAEYELNLSRSMASTFYDPMSCAIRYTSGRYVFQALLTNASSIVEPGRISNAEGSWGTGDIFIAGDIGFRF